MSRRVPSRAPVARHSASGHQPAGTAAPRHWYVQIYRGTEPVPPSLCSWYGSRAAARAAALELGGQVGPGKPRRAGAEPIRRVEIKLAASELDEIDSARGPIPRQRWITDAALERARRVGQR